MNAEKRNILFIICDQLRADFLAAYGGPAITPEISALAEASAVFTRAYTPTPVCAAARMSLLTGMHPLACPVRVPDSVKTLPQILGETGYTTAAIGKMHMSPPRGPCGFQELQLAEDTGPNMFLDDYHRWLAERGRVEWDHGLSNYDILPARSLLSPEETCTVWTGEAAVNYLKRRSTDGAPFYATVSFTKPHPPYDPLPASLNAVAKDLVPEPLGLTRAKDSYPQPVIAYRKASQCDALAPDLIQEIRMHYLALLVEIDQQVGRIMSTLRQTGLASKTTVLFAGDHGDFLGDHALFMKFFPYDSASRVPLFICGPGFERGRHETVVSLLDLFPTILDVCGQPVHGQGVSIRNRLQNEDARSGVVVSSAMGRGYCWVADRYKYTFWPHGEEELYDVEIDPEETVDLSDREPELRDQMRAALTEELTRIAAGAMGAVPSVIQGDRIRQTPFDSGRFERIANRYIQHKRL